MTEIERLAESKTADGCTAELLLVVSCLGEDGSIIEFGACQLVHR